MSRLVVLTDLDGTLLDHDSYSFRRALPALDLLVRRKIPVVPVSSKTSAEMTRWMNYLTLEGPFICENGCGIVIPNDYFSVEVKGARKEGDVLKLSLGSGISQVRKALGEIALELGVTLRGYGNMSSEEISDVTGLKGEELESSIRREYDEPFLMDGDCDFERLRSTAAKRGLTVLRGGRFYHLINHCDKGKASEVLLDLYRQEYGKIRVVGLGDSANDLEFLKIVDIPFVVQRPDGTYDPQIPEDAVQRIPGIGPNGWRIAIERFLAGEARGCEQ
ncbi:HAD-IIB family hydrolase [bacterium]|nr:MAG: HAD-IIB family hydrolase [bacterium]